MSTPGTPTAPTSLSITGNPPLDTLIGLALVGVSGAAATWGVEHIVILKQVDTTTLSLAILGVLAGLATAMWKWVNSKRAQAKAVQAGLNLGLSGNSISVKASDGTTSPLPITPMSAARIVKEFGDVKVSIPNEPQLTEALKQTQIVAK